MPSVEKKLPESALRVLQARNRLKMTQVEFAYVVNLQPATVSRYETGVLTPPKKFWKVLAEVEAGNSLALLKKRIQELEERLRAEQNGRSAPPGGAGGPGPAQARVNIVTREEWRQGLLDHLGHTIVEVPIVAAHAAAGPPMEISERDIEAAIQVPARWAPRGPGYYTAIKVRGDSMEPTLHNDDVVCVEPGWASDPRRLRGKLVAAMPDEQGGVVIKRLQKTTAEEIVLASDNPQHKPVVLKRPGWRVLIGPVVWVLSRQKL